MAAQQRGHIRWLAWLSWVALATVGAQQAGAAVLSDISFSTLPGDQVEIRMEFDGAPPEPTGYTIEQPARISLDLSGVSSALASKYHSLGTGNARSVTVVEAKDRTRVIVNLAELVPYTTQVAGNAVVVTVGASELGEFSPAARTAMQAASPSSADSAVTDVDFRRGEQGEGQVVVTLSDPKAQVDVRGEGGRVVVEIADTRLPGDLQRRLDVRDFATPVEIVDAVQFGDTTRLSIVPTGEYDYMAYQADETLTINVRRVTQEEQELDNQFRYTGEKLSLNFQDIEVRSVLQLIADFTDLNLVASDTVTGRITLRLKNTPWDQALELILKTKGLDKRQDGNVLLVAPAAEIAAREKLELENRRQIAELAPLRTEFIQVRYAKAAELFALFKGEGEGQSILSERGSVIVDERTNSIILTETADKLEEFRGILRQLDIPVRQVLIEARIVTANANFSESLGIRWGGLAFDRTSNENGIVLGGSKETVNEVTTGLANGDDPITFDATNALAVDLGVTGVGTTSFGIGFTGAKYLLDLELSALAADGHAEVVARPKVITSDKQSATILSGVEIPYQEASSSGATSTSFKEAVLSLEVTPQITPDDRIIMSLQVNQDSVGQVFNGVPSINTNEIATQVLVDNGQTLVLGGIFQVQTSESTTKTPFLGDLPYVGSLFRTRSQEEQKQELLIFITPRIIQDAISAR